VFEEIGYFLDCGGGTLGGDHRVEFVRLLAAVLTLAPAFFLGFPVASLGVVLVWAQASQACPFSWWRSL